MSQRMKKAKLAAFGRTALFSCSLCLVLASCAEPPPKVRFAESRATACSGVANAVSLANESFTFMRAKLADDDFARYYETARLIANLGNAIGDAADPDDIEFKAELANFSEALGYASGVVADFRPLMTDSVINDYFAMKVHHSEYVDEAAAEVATAAIGLTPFCP